MTSPIRPSILPAAQPSPQAGAADTLKLAAQRAFFDLALGKAAAPQASGPAARASAPSVPAVSAQRPAAQPDPDARQKTLRPGSILDIRV